MQGLRDLAGSLRQERQGQAILTAEPAVCQPDEALLLQVAARRAPLTPATMASVAATSSVAACAAQASARPTAQRSVAPFRAGAALPTYNGFAKGGNVAGLAVSCNMLCGAVPMQGARCSAPDTTTTNAPRTPPPCRPWLPLRPSAAARLAAPLDCWSRPWPVGAPLLVGPQARHNAAPHCPEQPGGRSRRARGGASSRAGASTRRQQRRRWRQGR